MARNRLAEDVAITKPDNGDKQLAASDRKPISPNEAAAAIVADKQRREHRAVDRHNEMCNDLQVDCVCVTQIVGGQVSQGIRFVAR